MQIKYYHILLDQLTSDEDIAIFAALSKYRLFTPKKNYRLAGLWRSCIARDHSATYHMVVAYERERPVGVMVYEPDDEHFVSFFVSTPYRRKGLATKLASKLMVECGYPNIWCMGKAKSVMTKIGYVTTLGKRTMHYPKRIEEYEVEKRSPLHRLWKRTAAYFRKPRRY